MAGLATRLVGDLKKDRKKTALLIALAAVFFYVWIPMMKSSDDPVPNPAAAKAGAANQSARRQPRSAKNRAAPSNQVELKSPPMQYSYPAFLSEPLQASLLGNNPFLPLASERQKNKIAVPEEKTEPSKNSVEVRREEELARIGTIKVKSILALGSRSSCTVDEQILYKGSVYKGFTVKAIENDYVLFAGQEGEYKVAIQNPR